MPYLHVSNICRKVWRAGGLALVARVVGCAAPICRNCAAAALPLARHCRNPEKVLDKGSAVL